MSSGMNVAASGMRAEELQFDAAANNIANSNTPDYTTERVDLQPLPGGGVETTPQGIPPADPTVSNDDLGQQMADMMSSTSLYSADAKVVTIQGRMNQSLFSILA